MSTISEAKNSSSPVSSASVREKHREFLFPSVANYYEEPSSRRRKGMYLYGADGNRYLDFFGGILTVSVGHATER